MRIKIVGVYPVEEALEPCHLIEVIVEGFQGDLNMSEFTQEVLGQPKDNWQVPWAEYVLDNDGAGGKLAPFPGPLAVPGSQRLAFFFHYLDISRPMITPIGEVELPEPEALPDRLSFMKYEAPD